MTTDVFAASVTLFLALSEVKLLTAKKANER